MRTTQQIRDAVKPPKPVKRRNDARQEKDFPRKYGSVERVMWFKQQACIVVAFGNCAGDIENAHVKGGGGSRKADAKWIVPMCHYHHIERLHAFGVRAFQQDFNVDLLATAETWNGLWEMHAAGISVTAVDIERAFDC